MIRINSKSLKESIGKYMATYEADATAHDPFKTISYAKIIEVFPANNKLTLERFGTNKEGERYTVYYRDDTHVDIYDEEEALLLMFRDFNNNDPENKHKNEEAFS